MDVSSKRSMLLLLLLAGAASGAELYAASFQRCNDPVAEIPLEFHNNECNLISWAGLKKVFPDKVFPETARMEEAFKLYGIGDEVGIKMRVDGAGFFSAEVFGDRDCGGFEMLSMPATEAGQCGTLKSVAFGAGDELPSLKVFRVGKSWLSGTVYLLPEDHDEGTIQIESLKYWSAWKNADMEGMTQNMPNGECLKVNLTNIREQIDAEFLPDIFVEATCYDGITRFRGGATGCSGGMLALTGVPDISVEVPTVDLPWGQNTNEYLKVYLYAPEAAKSLRVIYHLAMRVDACRLVSGKKFTPLGPVDNLPTLPPGGNDDAGGDEKSGGHPLPVWTIVVIGVAAVGAVGALIGFAVVKMKRKGIRASYIEKL